MNRKELLDYDYLHKLNDKELEYLKLFTEEYIHANFQNKKRIHPKKTAVKRKKKVLDKYKKESEDRNNARNRDLMNIDVLRNSESLDNSIVDQNRNIELDKNLTEDNLIDILDDES